MRRFFHDTTLNQQPLVIDNQIVLTDSVFHHWCRVLRANVGDTAVLFDGTGGEYQVQLIESQKKSASVIVQNFNPINRCSTFQTEIGLALSRGERMDYAIQKATEMGVSTIQLLSSDYSEVKLKNGQFEKKLTHWQQVAISACEQCGLNIIPKILPPQPLTTWVTQDFKIGLKLVLAVPRNNATHSQVNTRLAILQQLQQDFAKFYLLIGSEGGLSDKELSLALENSFLAWQLGERVLRTETAPVVALARLQMIDDFLQFNQLNA